MTNDLVTQEDLVHKFNINKEEKTVLETELPIHERTYEQKLLLNQYLLLHYGENAIKDLFTDTVCDEYHLQLNDEQKKKCGSYQDINFSLFDTLKGGTLAPALPFYALGFPLKVAELTIHFCKKYNIGNERAIDIGCATGRTTFELTRYFKKSIGIDYSQQFLQAANILRKGTNIQYDIILEGDISIPSYAKIDNDSIKRENTTFIVGDATKLNELNLGTFNCVVAANLIDRVENPLRFLQYCNELVEDGGILIIISPYTWLKSFTSKERWLGGYYCKESNEPITTFQGIKNILSNNFNCVHQSHLPMWIHETIHKTQYTLCHASIWCKEYCA